jgi:hypothetical protein
MIARRLSALALVVGLALLGAPAIVAGRGRLPAHLTDQEFWRLSYESSEPNGYFRSDNLTSNELWFQHVVPDLIDRTHQGDVYLGVGPEQNYTYIAAVRPAMAIIFDIRRGNFLLQLMYKAAFELSADRGDFVSLLFSKPRPAGLSADSTVGQLFAAFGGVPSSSDLYVRNLQAIEDRLTRTHQLPLSAQDLTGIEYVFHSFYWNGFAVRPTPTYDELMMEDDGNGAQRSYLASEANYGVLKQLEAHNLVVPIVGDFGGPKAIRAIGAYLKSHDATVSAFYLSNVEQYLYQEGKFRRFCLNAASLPLDASSTFIRSSSGGALGVGRGLRFISSLGDMLAETNRCAP